jgi:hypothetical protein
MTDVLYISGIIAFVAVMLGFMFVYGRRTGGSEFDGSGPAATSDDGDARRSVAG